MSTCSEGIGLDCVLNLSTEYCVTGSSTTWRAIKGTTYLIFVTANTWDVGSYYELRLYSVYYNEASQCSSAVTIPSIPISLVGNIAEQAISTINCNGTVSQQQGMYFIYTPAQDTVLVADLCATISFNLFVIEECLYDVGQGCFNYTPGDCEEGGQHLALWPAYANTAYTIAIAPSSYSSFVSFEMELTSLEAAVGNNCLESNVITKLPYTVSGSLLLQDASAYSCNDQNSETQAMYFRYESSVDQVITASVCGSEVSCIVLIFSECSSSGVASTCQSDYVTCEHATISWSAKAGIPYYIAVMPLFFAGDIHPFILEVHEGPFHRKTDGTRLWNKLRACL